MLREMFPEKGSDIDELIEEGRDCEEVVEILLEGRVACILREVGDAVLDRFASMPVLATSRSCIWNQAKVFYKRGLGDPSLLRKNFSVSFGGEEGIDGGALRNEFFVSVMRHLNEEFFEGQVERRLPRCHWGSEVEQKMAGVMVAHCLLFGGPGLPCLHPAVYDGICGKEVEDDSINVQDIPVDPSTAETIELINKVHSY